jgi:putative ABC transport system ATP-binding protein
MFVLENVVKRYMRHGREVVALRTEHVELRAGSYTSVIGPSGCGKTTLLSLLGGMLSPNTGHVYVNGMSLYDMSVSARTQLRRTKIGFVFQAFNLIPYLTALENVQVPMALAGQTAATQRRRAGELLERVGLGDRVNHRPSELSTGQQQRVAIARTLASHPTVSLADEPTGNLDPASRAMVLSFFDEFHRDGRTIVMVTHDPSAAAHAERQLAMRDGGFESVVQLARAA